MTRVPTTQIIDRLASEARPVKPLAPPLWRALWLIGFVGVSGSIAVLAAGDVPGMIRRYAGQEMLMVAEMAAMAMTAMVAIVAGFMLSVPGRSRAWMFAPVPSLLLWFVLSGVGCLFAPATQDVDHQTDCLLFIFASSLIIGAPMLWRLSRAHPIDPLPVALLAGLGAAASSAFLLQFFHPFSLTPLDLAVHLGTVLLVLAVSAIVRRPLLAPA